MRKQIATAFMVMLSLCVSAQTTVKRDSLGNFYAVKSAKKESTKTGYTFTDSKGNNYPVYQNSAGRYFIIRTSAKTGKQYKQYLKN
jgi:hypothetical protein